MKWRLQGAINGRNGVVLLPRVDVDANANSRVRHDHLAAHHWHTYGHLCISLRGRCWIKQCNYQAIVHVVHQKRTSFLGRRSFHPRSEKKQVI